MTYPNSSTDQHIEIYENGVLLSETSDLTGAISVNPTSESTYSILATGIDSSGKSLEANTDIKVGVQPVLARVVRANVCAIHPSADSDGYPYPLSCWANKDDKGHYLALPNNAGELRPVAIEWLSTLSYPVAFDNGNGSICAIHQPEGPSNNSVVSCIFDHYTGLVVRNVDGFEGYDILSLRGAMLRHNRAVAFMCAIVEKSGQRDVGCFTWPGKDQPFNVTFLGGTQPAGFEHKIDIPWKVTAGEEMLCLGYKHEAHNRFDCAGISIDSNNKVAFEQIPMFEGKYDITGGCAPCVIGRFIIK